MRGFIHSIFLVFPLIYILLFFSGCAIKLKPQFSALRDMPPEALKAANPAEVEVMTTEPPIGREYIELGYITVDESKVSPILTMSTSDKDVIEMVRKEAADHGADAVINFKISGEHPGRKATGIAIVYMKR